MKVLLWGYRCLRCNHEWLPRTSNKQKPKVCAKCKSYLWDTPRQSGGLPPINPLIATDMDDAFGRLLWLIKSPIIRLRSQLNVYKDNHS